jgi:hypothetical protein
MFLLATKLLKAIYFIPIVMAEGRLGQETATTNQVNCVAVGWFEEWFAWLFRQ